MEPLIGHSSQTDDSHTQSLKVHSCNVAQLCGDLCRTLGLEHLGRVTGLTHDAGKSFHLIQLYLKGEWHGEKLNHSSAGARYLWETFGQNTKKSSCRLAAQFAAVAIECHHGTRCDLYSPEDGGQPWLDKLYSEKADPLYRESCEQFFSQCVSEEEVAAEMELAAKEVLTLYRKLGALSDQLSPPGSPEAARTMQFMLGLVQRFLFGALVDADWSDTASFENGPQPEPELPSWTTLRENVERYLQNLPALRSIDILRSEISEQCKAAGQTARPGIYRLYVPTGGGKTYSGLRYCVHAAEQTHATHIFYFAPYRSIIGQNTECFRAALGDKSYVLEHHSDVLCNEDEHEALLPFTQRWQGVPFIATTMVQFLNTLFSAPRRNVRRFPALANSVLFFDEVQSLPTCHTYLFNLAVNLLAYGMGCTVILCTATQPALEQLAYPLHFSEPKDLVPDYAQRFEQFKRTRIVPLSSEGGYSSADFAALTQEKLRSNDTILLIFNTRAVVERVYDLLREQLEPDVLLYCLTTHLCPQHRLDVLDQIKKRLDDPYSTQKLVCVSTQLIEAGVDLSFDCVIRSMAGLPSVAQAAGRCNRHGETDCRSVYLVPCAPTEEHLEQLADLDEGRRATQRLLHQLSPDADLLDPASIQAYYALFYAESHQQTTMQAPLKNGWTLLDLFSENKPGVTAYIDLHSAPFAKVELRQAFGTAEAAFRALDSDTTPAVVPYGKNGQELVTQLLSTDRPTAALLREAQHYTIGLYHNEFLALSRDGALSTAVGGAVFVLDPRYYDDIKGFQLDPHPPELMIY